MDILISIPDHLYKLLKDFPSDSNEGTIENVLMKAVENGTPIPDNATNGDVIKAMFGKEFADKCIDYCNAHMVGGDWWNAPYQIGIYFTDYRQR